MMQKFFNQKGMNLIEVMIAAAMIGGMALIVAQFVPDQIRQTAKIQSSSQCQTRVSAILSRIKSYDNNRVVDSWLPSNSQLNPRASGLNFGASNRIVYNLLSDNQTPIAYTAPSTMSATPSTGFSYALSNDELAMTTNVRSWQLIQSASSLIGGLYLQNPICGNYTAPTGFLAQMVGNTTIPGEQSVEVQVRTLDSSGNDIGCPVWQPFPAGQANSRIMSVPNLYEANVFKIGVRVTYTDTSGQQRPCTGSATLSPGRFNQQPNFNISMDPSSHPTNGGLFCGNQSPGPRVSYRIRSNQNGLSYLCKLSYAQDSAGAANAQSSNWFICSLGMNSFTPFASPPKGAVSVNARNVTNRSFDLDIANTYEGWYQLQVMAIDPAGNYRVQSAGGNNAADFLVDLYRPGITIAPANLVHNPPHEGEGHQSGASLPSHLQPAASQFSMYNMQCQSGTVQFNSTYASTAPSDEPQINVSNNSDIFSYIDCNGAGASATITQDGCYIANAQALDECGNGGSATYSWLADLTAFDPIPNPRGSVTMSRPIVEFDIGATSPSTLNVSGRGMTAELPVATGCPVWGLPNMLFQRGSTANCSQSEWSNASTGSIPYSGCVAGGKACYVAIDACGRFAQSASEDMNVYGYSNGAGIKDSCENRPCAPGYFCGEEGAALGLCHRASEVRWTANSECSDGSTSCQCFGSSYRCDNNLYGPTACPGTQRNNCSVSPWLRPSCPSDFILVEKSVSGCDESFGAAPAHGPGDPAPSCSISYECVPTASAPAGSTTQDMGSETGRCRADWDNCPALDDGPFGSGNPTCPSLPHLSCGAAVTPTSPPPPPPDPCDGFSWQYDSADWPASPSPCVETKVCDGQTATNQSINAKCMDSSGTENPSCCSGTPPPQTRTCYEGDCPCDVGTWSWTAWAPVESDVTCDPSQSEVTTQYTQTRDCTNGSGDSNLACCSGDPNQENTYISSCSDGPVHCQGDWGTCSCDSSGVGTQTFEEIQPAQNGGDPCSPAIGTTQDCSFECDVDCQGSWGTCEGACGTGTETYTITQAAQGNGASCEAAHNETRDCNTGVACTGQWCPATCYDIWASGTFCDPTPPSGTCSPLGSTRQKCVATNNSWVRVYKCEETCSTPKDSFCF